MTRICGVPSAAVAPSHRWCAPLVSVLAARRSDKVAMGLSLAYLRIKVR